MKFGIAPAKSSRLGIPSAKYEHLGVQSSRTTGGTQTKQAKKGEKYVIPPSTSDAVQMATASFERMKA